MMRPKPPSSCPTCIKANTLHTHTSIHTHARANTHARVCVCVCVCVCVFVISLSLLIVRVGQRYTVKYSFYLFLFQSFCCRHFSSLSRCRHRTTSDMAVLILCSVRVYMVALHPVVFCYCRFSISLFFPLEFMVECLPIVTLLTLPTVDQSHLEQRF